MVGPEYRSCLYTVTNTMQWEKYEKDNVNEGAGPGG